MAIKVTCGECGAEYQVSAENAGRRFKCKSCGKVCSAPDRTRQPAPPRDRPRRRPRPEPEDEDEPYDDEYEEDDEEFEPRPQERQPVSRGRSGQRSRKKRKKKGVPKGAVVASIVLAILAVLSTGGWFLYRFIGADWIPDESAIAELGPEMGWGDYGVRLPRDYRLQGFQTGTEWVALDWDTPGGGTFLFSVRRDGSLKADQSVIDENGELSIADLRSGPITSLTAADPETDSISISTGMISGIRFERFEWERGKAHRIRYVGFRNGYRVFLDWEMSPEESRQANASQSALTFNSQASNPISPRIGASAADNSGAVPRMPREVRFLEESEVREYWRDQPVTVSGRTF